MNMIKVNNTFKVLMTVAVLMMAGFAFMQIASAPETASAYGDSGCGGCNDGGGNQGGGDRDDPLPPVCNYLKADKTSLPAGGGNVTLDWSTNRGVSAKLTPDGSAVPVNGSKTVNVTDDTTFVLRVTNGGGSAQCQTTVTVDEPAPIPKCELTANPMTVKKGESTLLTWTSMNVIEAVIDQGVGSVNPNGSITVTPLETTTYTYTGRIGGEDYIHCPVTVKVEEKPEEKECKIQITKSVNKTEAKIGEELTYTINIKNIGTGDCTGGGVKIVDIHDTGLKFVSETHSDNLSAGYNAIPLYTEGSRTLNWNGHTLTPGEQGTITWIGKVKEREQCGNFEILNKAKTTAKELNNFETWVISNQVMTKVENKCDETEPSCEMFGNPTTIKKGESSTLTWSSNKLTEASIDQGIGAVSLSGSKVVSPATTTTYTFKGKFGGEDFLYCPVTINVTEEPEPGAPTCDSFTATPNSFNNGVGGGVTLTWTTSNADSVTIDNGIGAVAVDGTTGTSVTDDTTFTLTAVKGNQSVSCPVTVTVTEPEAPTLSCDSFTASPTSLPRGGGSVTLTWATTDATDVSINNGIGTVAVDGNTTVNVTSDTTFTLTLRDDKANTKSCDASVTVATGGGGGGGSSAPRCELTISDTKIKAGDEVTISWDNSRVNEMILEDNRGNVLIDTEKTTNYDEDEGSIEVKPTRDTEYTMTVSRGSRDRVCRVSVEMDDDVTVISTRTQTPQVAGIALTQVPYTGFEAGPFLTLLFYSLLAVWAAFIAYMIVIKEQTATGLSSNGNNTVTNNNNPHVWEEMVDQMHDNLDKEDSVVASAMVADTPYISPVRNSDGTPANLPTGETPVIGYRSLIPNITPVAEEEVDEMTDLENTAHLKQALLSSDALNYFMENYSDQEERFQALTNTIEKAKGEFPSEGGWMVLNLERVQELNQSTITTKADSFVPDTRVGVSSLAEAIVNGNVGAAYSMIDNRPMFALADAAADLDAVYRARKGIDTEVSSLLATATAKLSDVQIESMIKALTGALDGTYTDEKSAVKMAIMKAIKITG